MVVGKGIGVAERTVTGAVQRTVTAVNKDTLRAGLDLFDRETGQYCGDRAANMRGRRAYTVTTWERLDLQTRLEERLRTVAGLAHFAPAHVPVARLREWLAQLDQMRDGLLSPRQKK